MCARYHSVLGAARLKQFFKLNGLNDILAAKDEVFPGYAAPLIGRPPERGSGDDAVPDREVVMGLFGLLPHWAKDRKLAKSTYNARSETVAVKTAFRDPRSATLGEAHSTASSRPRRSGSRIGAAGAACGPGSVAPTLHAHDPDRGRRLYCA
jgi:hypothetical protein